MENVIGDYPRVDDRGTVWLDPTGIQAENERPCFMCGNPTRRVDIQWAAFYCMSPSDERSIMRSLVPYYDNDDSSDYPREENGRE